MIVAILAAVLAVQTAALLFGAKYLTDRAAEERRFLINQALAKTPQEFAMMAAAARPDETVESLAEYRSARSNTPMPLGL